MKNKESENKYRLASANVAVVGSSPKIVMETVGIIVLLLFSSFYFDGKKTLNYISNLSAPYLNTWLPYLEIQDKKAMIKTAKIAGLRLVSQCQQIKVTLFEKTTFCS